MNRAELDSSDVLARIISTVGSSLELDEVLRAIVRLLSEGSAVHACFVYLVEDDGERLVLRAAGEPYEHLIGKIALERPRGLAWWAAEHDEPAFIPDHLLDDPRVEYVPELEEERFQSLLCVPIAARDGTVIGVISAHTEAPREFTEAEVEFLVTSASLVAGAIENARLYEEARTRVRALEGLTGLAEEIASARTIDDLVPEVAGRARELLQARACHLYLLEPGSEQLLLRASAPSDIGTPPSLGLAELGPELARRRRASRLAVRLIAGDELLGLLVAEGTSAIELARAVASQAAVGIKKIQLIEHLTEKNLIKDFFEDIAAGRLGPELEGRAARLDCDLELAHVVLAAGPVGEQFERALAVALPGSLFDRRDDSLRALLRCPAGPPGLVAEAARRAQAQLEPSLAVGLSSVCAGAASLQEGFAEARQALLGATIVKRETAVVAFEELGAYKYLLRIAVDTGARDTTIEALSRLAAYDADRGSSLLRTLEEFLYRHGSISATSEALFVHPNTLRQRLRRIGELSGIDLRRDDWLMVEIALKLVRLRVELGAIPDISVR